MPRDWNRSSVSWPVARPARRRASPLEKHEQAGIVKLLRSMGADVYVLGTRRPRKTACPHCKALVGETQGTRQTPGLPDVIAFLKTTDALVGRFQVAIECKRKGGTMSPDQERFQASCAASGVAHIVGNLDDVMQWLVAKGFLNANQVSHFHLQERQ
jgi:hypothetical protein